MLPSLAVAQTSMYGWVQKRLSEGGTGYEMDVIGLSQTPLFDKQMTLDYTAMANGGVGITDGKLSVVYVNKTNLLWGELTAKRYEYDANTWQQLAVADITDPTVIALETAQHAATGKVYGMFYQADLNTRNFDWGVIDYATLTRTTLAMSTHRMVAVGVTQDEILYGIATDGYLYRFNPVTRVETQVGKTGVTVASSAVQSGEIDQKTGVFYWAYTSGQGKSALYTVDLESGAATKLCDFAGNEQVAGLTMIPAPIADNVPAAVTDLQVSFAGASTTGVVAFTAPATCHDGTALEGSLTYLVTANGEIVGTGQVQAGKPKTIEVTVDEGQNEFVAWVANDNGDGPKARKSLYVGNDVPLPATDAALAINDGVATVTWIAPTRGMHDAYMGQLTYDVIRYPQGDCVASGVTETTFTEALTNANIIVYHYGIVVHNGTQQSAETLTNEVKYGTSGLYDVPIEFGFTDDQFVNELRATDGNGDGKTWSYSVQNKALASNTTRQSAGDDWCFMPAVSLKAGYTYSISVHAKTYLASYPTRIEAKMGSAAQPQAMTLDVLSAIDLTTNQYNWYKAEVKVNVDGAYYLGVHDVSEATGFSTHIDDITIEVASMPHAPDSVTAFTVVPDPNGALTSTLSFVTPSLSTDGDPLTLLSRVEVTRDGELIATFDEVQPGQSFNNIVDAVEADGFHTYAVVCYAGDDAGLAAEQRVYVGIDIPEAPQNLYAIDKGTAIELHWDKASPRGINGGLVIPEQVSYDVLAGDMITHIDTVMTNMIVIDSITTTGTQHIARFYVKAHNRVGRNDYYIPVVLPLGKPFGLPYQESFAGGKAGLFCWSEGTTTTRTVNPQVSADDDGGSYMIVSEENGSRGSFNTAKVSLKNAANPNLIFNYRVNTLGVENDLRILVMKPDHSTDTLRVIHLAQLATTDWQLADVQLGEYVNEEYVVVKLDCMAGADTKMSTFIDRVIVRDVKERDLAVTAFAPVQAVIGNNLIVRAQVSNVGATAVGVYQVQLYAGDKCVAQQSNENVLEPEQSRNCTMSFTTNTINQAAGLLPLRVVVTCDRDDDMANNEAQVSVDLRDANASPVDNLQFDDNLLTWDAPTLASEDVIDDFESYVSQQVSDVGAWSFYDGDKSESATISSTDYGHQGEPFAFMTFNPQELGLDRFAELMPRSGNQSMMAIVGYNAGSKVDCDNWLISPQLPGCSQIVSVWVKNVGATETLEVMYSKSSIDPTNFMAIKSESVSDKAWKQIEVELPEGARYFAVRHTTAADDAMILLVDDATFTQLAGNPVAYRVYCDGVLISEVANATQLDVATLSEAGEHQVAVTAVYASGAESAPRVIAVQFTTPYDLNGDGKVDIADINVIINMVLGKSAKSAAADFTGDGAIDISDINALINAILGK